MTVTRDQYRGGYTWDEWLEQVEARGGEWRGRYDAAALGELRADYQQVPTPRYVMCLVDDACTDSIGSVPYIAKACSQAAVSGGIELRVFTKREDPGLMKQYLTEGAEQTPICVVFDQDWVQVGVWGPRPEPLLRRADELEDNISDEELERQLDDWYRNDAGQTTLREFLAVLRGEPIAPTRATKEQALHLHKQAERARER